jgi:mono/diheme cytochrome c family protein
MKMIGHYGCSACHNIAGFEDAVRPGTDLTLWAEKFMSQLDFAFYSPPFEHEVEEQKDVFEKLFMDMPEFEHLVRDAGENPKTEILHNHAAFAYHKLRNPRIWDRKKIKKPYEKLKMPNFFFTEEEARSLVAYLLSLRQANVYKDVQIPYDKTPAGKIAAGRALVRDLNCVGCHKIEGNDPVIQQYYSNDPNSPPDTDPRNVRFKPPLLWGEGAKVQYNWLFTFLNNVEMLRPWMKARMPSFALTKEQTTTLVEYFVGLAQDESHLLKRELDPIEKMIAAAHGDGGTANTWFLEDKMEDQAKFLKLWAGNKQQTGPFEWQVGDAASKDYAAKLAGPFEKSIKRAEFLANLFNVQYPFSDPIQHLADEERFKRGEAMFYNLKCLACHVAGDPKAPGTTTDIKAPNFALTYKRLRYDWVIYWLQDPQAIQPGANMPQIFQGGSAYAAVPSPEREKLEGQFGKTVEEQSHLLVDFIYTLGARGYTAIQPGAATAASQSPEQPAVQFDFDSGGNTEKKPEQKPPTSQPAKSEFDF